ncbi:hypothetical protein OF001_U100037 [Pseudomonas sp. OF001]|nr:hypothetical protein OF001_U100037 [Pseudomonas sp. OF001]
MKFRHPAPRYSLNCAFTVVPCPGCESMVKKPPSDSTR